MSILGDMFKNRKRINYTHMADNEENQGIKWRRRQKNDSGVDLDADKDVQGTMNGHEKASGKSSKKPNNENGKSEQA